MLLDCGNSSEVIKGECGWGAELPFFDKTGAVKGTFSRRKYEIYACPVPGGVAGTGTCYVCKTKTVSCSSEEDGC